LASSCTLELYVEAGYVEGDYVTQKQICVVELNTDDSTLTGIAEVSGVGSGSVQTDNSDVDGIAARTITGAGSLTVDSSNASGVAEREVETNELDQELTTGPSTIVGTVDRTVVINSGIAQGEGSEVDGSAGRTVTIQSIDLQVQDTTVAGDAERIITSSGNLVVDNPSVVLGTSEGVRVVVGGIAQVDDSQVTAVVQRTVHDTDTNTQAQVSEITGVAERTVVDGETDLTVSESEVDGSGGRKVSGTGVDQAQESIVSGIAERTINSIEADLTAEEVGVIVVAGDAERKVITQVSAVVVDSNSQVDTTVKRSVFGIDATPQAQVSEITGVAERTVVGSGVLVDGNSTIDASAERVLSASGVEQAQTSSVSGIAERIIDDEDQLDVNINSDPSTVTGVAERTVVVVGSVAPQTVTYTVTNSGAGAYLIDGVANAPLEFKRGWTYVFNVSASGHPFWINSVSGTGTGNAYNDGVTNNGTQSGTITFVVPDDAPDDLFYNCQFHASMQGTISVGSTNIATLVADQSEILSTANIGRLTSVELNAVSSTLAGTAERVIDDEDQLDLNLNSGPSTVGGVVNITSNGTGTLQSQQSVLSGTAERVIDDEDQLDLDLNSGPSTIDGLAERVITSTVTLVDNSNLVTGEALRAITASGIEQVDDSNVSGVAERTIVTEQGIEQVDNSEVVAVVKRTVHSIEADLTAEEVGVSVVAGDGEREVISIPAAFKPTDNNEVSGVAEREIRSAVNIKAQTSVVVGAGIVTRVVLSSPIKQTAHEVDGLAERIIVGEGDLHAGDSTLIDVEAEIILDSAYIPTLKCITVRKPTTRIIMCRLGTKYQRIING